ncbi:MAG TPA: NAD(P)H-dependent glycerol-3-phosphate dehydrogenase [Terriglobales bacterium]|nr:NAD(P)H-dependent glycerol-3-phosphate dehydrogenase [Terriglobales bacterium]
MSRVAVIGAGAWGTALAIALGRKGGDTIHLWANESDVVESIGQRRVNERFLPGFNLPDSIEATRDLDVALRGAEIVVSVMPSQYCRALFQRMAAMLSRETLLVSCTKGLENGTLSRMSEVIEDVMRERKFRARVGALSGPSFAKEVARGDPTAVTVASTDSELARAVQQAFNSSRFRVYTNDDVIGVELGGALKNIIAIAAGVCDGLGLGHNSVAALITRGLAEIARLVVACGGRLDTMAGLAGLGDLVLTCTGDLSRNRSVGVELGKGRKLPDIIAGMHGAVAEGVFTTKAAMGLAQTKNVEMPITEQMFAILEHGKAPQQAIEELMTRAARAEVY